MTVMEITINDQQIIVKEGTSILKAARASGIYIPSLCHHPSVPFPELIPEKFIYRGDLQIYNDPSLDISNHCNLCIVHVKGRESNVRACTTIVEPEMVVTTETEEIKRLRKERFISILSYHPNICLTCDRDPRCPPFGVCSRSANVPDRCVACPKYATCELIRIADHIGMTGVTIPREPIEFSTIDDNPFLEFNPNLCVGCTRCVRFCKEVRGVGALGYVLKGGRIITGTKAPTFLESGCHFCFGCVEVCPTGALIDIKEKWKETKEETERKKNIVPCMAACPLHIDVPKYINYITQKKYDKAMAVIQEKLPFASLCATVCTHPCEQACRRNEMDRPVAIKNLKRFVVENVPYVYDKIPADTSGKKIAIVGSGPAGLTAAYYLQKIGHAVTVFESLPSPGGMPFTGIPRFRLPKQVMDKEIELIRKTGVEIVVNTLIDSITSLFEDGYHAVLMAIGAHQEIRLNVPGENAPSICGGIEFLRKVNMGDTVDLGDSVAVIGGGNVAFDAARVAKRMGVKDVTIVYRRSIVEMPAGTEEIEQATAEGIHFLYLSSPVRYETNGEKTRVECIKYKLKRPDASGRRRPMPIKGSTFSFYVDTVITAIGQYTKIPDAFNVDSDDRGCFVVDYNTYMTSAKGVFAAGDALSCPKTVTEAIASGVRAANAINIYLGGKEIVDNQSLTLASLPQKLEPGNKFLCNRVQMPLRSVEDRIDNFKQVELGYTEQMALQESERCLRCSLRLDIQKT